MPCVCVVFHRAASGFTASENVRSAIVVYPVRWIIRVKEPIAGLEWCAFREKHPAFTDHRIKNRFTHFVSAAFRESD